MGSGSTGSAPLRCAWDGAAAQRDGALAWGDTRGHVRPGSRDPSAVWHAPSAAVPEACRRAARWASSSLCSTPYSIGLLHACLESRGNIVEQYSLCFFPRAFFLMALLVSLASIECSNTQSRRQHAPLFLNPISWWQRLLSFREASQQLVNEGLSRMKAHLSLGLDGIPISVC